MYYILPRFRFVKIFKQTMMYIAVILLAPRKMHLMNNLILRGSGKGTWPSRSALRLVVSFPGGAMHNQGDKNSPDIKRQGMGTLKNLKIRPIEDLILIDFGNLHLIQLERLDVGIPGIFGISKEDKNVL